jgi:DNA-3-methyladenine glycosylase I
MALHADDSHPLSDIFKELAGRDDSQYSYKNALVAELDGKPAGSIIGYDGARLHELRKPLYELMVAKFGSVRPVEDETSAGEFYVDSIAVLPEYRGRGVGRALLADLCRRVFAKGFDKVGLLVDVTNPKAENLYASLGFRRVNPTTFLGLDMWHMQKENEPKK